VSETENTSTVRVSSEHGGRITFARLAWPGYQATIDGREHDSGALDEIFVSVEIPAGTENAELEVTWRPPGMPLGIATFALGLIGIGVLHLLYVRHRSR